MLAVVITKHGGPGVLEVQEQPDPQLGAGDVRIDVAAAGINFADVMARMGLYQDAPKTPCVVGYEVAGTVLELGEGVQGLTPGHRVVAGTMFGGYASQVVVPASDVVALPDELSFEQGAAIPVNYGTAWAGLIGFGSLRAGERVLVGYVRKGVSHRVEAKHVVLACYECETLQEVYPEAGEDVKWFHINQIDFASTLPGTKEFVSLAVANEWFDRLYIEFESVDSEASTSKRFTVATQPTLYSRYGLVKYWGRVGTSPRTKIEEFASPKELDEQIFETAKRRLAGGYHIRVLQGPESPPEVITRIRELARQWNEHFPVSDNN